MEFKNYQNYNMRGLIKIHELPKYVQVYNKLLLMIKRGQYPPASKLPSEGELAKNFWGESCNITFVTFVA